MRILRDSSDVSEAAFGAVAALGNFDGLHLGHQAVIGEALKLAREASAPAMVLTFEPHPRQLFHPHLPPQRILPLHEKTRLLEQMGVDVLRIVRFTRAFASTSARDFITGLLHEELQVLHVVTGEDFTFGHQREGNVNQLKQMAKQLGFKTTACADVLVEGERCSSTRIRQNLGQGHIGQAAALLGRPYYISGWVQEGDKRGRQLGFPTANIYLPQIFLPAFGVYAVRVTVGGKAAKGVANLGLRPTFAGQSPRLEVHLFDWDAPLYGERMIVTLVQYIRPEKKFDGVEALKTQIAEDCGKAKSLL